MSKKKINVFGLLAVSMAAAMLLNNSGMTVLAAGLDENYDESEETIEVSDNDEEDELIISSSELLDENPVSYSYGNLIYELDEKGNAVITGNTITEDTDLIIPSKIDGHKVVSIGKKAFYECSSLMSVTIPDSVTSINEDAFLACSNLKSLTIPDRVTSIGEFAFDECSSLTSLIIGNSVTSIGKYAFGSCSSLTSIKIPDSVTSLGYGAFCECSSLKSITIGNGVKTIGEKAFWACSSLTSITIGNSVETIGNEAFENCSSLTSVIIPNSVTSLGDGAFLNCSSLTKVTIGTGVTSIGYSTFSYCSSLTSVTIPNSVTSIRAWAFDYCSSLTSITIPNTVTSLGEGVFFGCSSLTRVTLSKSLKEIKTETFSDCLKLESIVIYPTTTEIAEDAFGDNKNFTIYGIIGSYAEEWANSHGVKFAAIYTVTDIFDDVKPTDWFVKVVQYVYDHGIMAGVNGGKSFDPHGKLTREQFTQVLYAYEGKPDVTNMSGFSDVDANAWYAKSVYWAKEKGITGGKPDGTFGVNENISRQDLAVMLYTYAKIKNYDLTKNDNALDNFDDKGKVSNYAKDAMKWAVTQGVISGKGNGKVDPIGNATRAECATMIMKLIEKNK